MICFEAEYSLKFVDDVWSIFSFETYFAKQFSIFLCWYLSPSGIQKNYLHLKVPDCAHLQIIWTKDLIALCQIQSSQSYNFFAKLFYFSKRYVT